MRRSLGGGREEGCPGHRQRKHLRRHCGAPPWAWRAGAAKNHWRRSALRQRSSCLSRPRNPAFLRCATDTGKGFPSGSVCAGRAARNSVPGKWNVRNPRRRCRRLAVGYRQRDIALPHDAREKRSTEPSCTQCPKPVVIRSIVRKDPLREAVEKRWREYEKSAREKRAISRLHKARVHESTNRLNVRKR